MIRTAEINCLHLTPELLHSNLRKRIHAVECRGDDGADQVGVASAFTLKNTDAGVRLFCRVEVEEGVEHLTRDCSVKGFPIQFVEPKKPEVSSGE